MTTLHRARAKGEWALKRSVEQTRWTILASSRYVIFGTGSRVVKGQCLRAHLRAACSEIPWFTDLISYPWECPNQRSRPESDRPSQRVAGVTDDTEHQGSISKRPGLVRDAFSRPNREGVPGDFIPCLHCRRRCVSPRVEQRPLLTCAFICVQHFLISCGSQTESVFPREAQSRELLATPTMQVCNTPGAPMPLPRRPCSIGRHISLGGPAGIGVGVSLVERRSMRV